MEFPFISRLWILFDFGEVDVKGDFEGYSRLVNGYRREGTGVSVGNICDDLWAIDSFFVDYDLYKLD